MNLNFREKKALVRVDFNVPLDGDFNVTDDTRIRRSLPTIKAILNDGGSVILMSHLGRPQKKLKEDGSIDYDRFTLRHVAPTLSELLQLPVRFADRCVGPQATLLSSKLESGEVLLLENTRFHKEEAAGDAEFAKSLAALADVYVNDAFGSAHRAHASTTRVAEYFGEDEKSFGLLMQSEIENAEKVLHNPQRPLVAITGGAKVSDKLLLLEKLIEFADKVIVGGGMAYTFIKANGGRIGESICEDDKMELALDLQKKAIEKDTELLLPVDHVIADGFSNDANKKVVPKGEIPEGWEGLDAGPETIQLFTDAIKTGQTIIWNGPMGVFEFDSFAVGTNAVAKAVAQATKNGAFSLIGGGDSVAAIEKGGLADQVSFVSTGGGAMLEFLEGKQLPGIAAIRS